jgi:CheY-like chemotaxis protein
VKDSGPGIAPDQQERIFEEFYQIEGGLSRSTGGTGLGLAIARKFARLMGGDVRIQSDAGGGSEFIIELPGVGKIADGEVKADQPKVAMLVRPNLPVEELSARVLGRLHLVTSSDPARVAAMARKEELDLMVLDALAPEYGAWRTLAALQEDAISGCTVPTLLISMEVDRREEAIELCRFCVATKPVAVQAVLPTVWAAGGGRERVRTVVLADSDPVTRRVLSDALGAFGCAVNHATNGTEAVQLTQVVQPDVAILGLLMPAQNGIAAAARMHDTPSLRDIPVVVLAPREMSAVEMHQLHASVVNLARSRADRQLSLAELLVRVSSQMVRQEDREGVLS